MKKFVLILTFGLSWAVVLGDTATVDGITWTYVVNGGNVSVGGGSFSASAVPRKTTGAITIPSELGGCPVTSIGGNAFSGCSGLTSVTIPDSVTDIDATAFSYCGSLMNIVVEEDNATRYMSVNGLLLSKDGRSLVRGINGDVSIPDSVTSIGYSAFSGCSGLTSVTIPDGVTSIGGETFSGCSGLTSVTIPSGVTSIGRLAFSDCSGLTSVTIPDGVTSIEDHTFWGCSGLTSVTIPSGVTSIGEGAFSGCSGLTSVTIPDSVRSIGGYAFSGCSGLTSVTIPDSVRSIGGYAFEGCNSLKRVKIPQCVCSSRMSVMFPSAYGSITNVVVGDNVSSIGDSAFDGCKSLSSLDIPCNVMRIGSLAFRNCSGLRDVTIPQVVCSSGLSSVFPDAYEAITNVVVSHGVTAIADEAFSNCANLVHVSIPDSVMSIGANVFDGCSNLLFNTESIFGVKLIDGWAVGNTGSLSGTLDLKEVRRVGSRAFANCENIAGVIFSSNVVNIDCEAFYGCAGLLSITIPGSVLEVGEKAFANCAALRHVKVAKALKEQIELRNVFEGCSMDLEIDYIDSEVKNVAVRQRRPWGKVEVSFDVVVDMAAGLQEWNRPVLAVSATDRTTGSNHVAQASALSGDTGTAEGAHHVIWDMKAQGLDFVSDDVVFTVGYESYDKYCVIDLAAGANAASYPVSYLAEVPEGGWTDEYKTTKLVLRLIEPGSIPTRDAAITKPFYIGVFEVTQKQYELVAGSNPSQYKGDMRPVEKVSWNMVRGDSGTYNWPSVTGVDPNSFMGRIQERTGLNFDLPTEAQWEYACRAGTTTDFNNGINYGGNYDNDSNLDQLGRYSGNQSDGIGGYMQHTTVGSYLLNAWGLYDMHGNVEEWCLDWLSYDTYLSGIDPVGSSSGSYRVYRGGDWGSGAYSCTSSIRSAYGSPSSGGFYRGFRLVRILAQ